MITTPEYSSNLPPMKTLRVSVTDADATDSSSDEDAASHLKRRRVRKYIHEVTIIPCCGDGDYKTLSPEARPSEKRRNAGGGRKSKNALGKKAALGNSAAVGEMGGGDSSSAQETLSSIHTSNYKNKSLDI